MAIVVSIFSIFNLNHSPTCRDGSLLIPLSITFIATIKNGITVFNGAWTRWKTTTVLRSFSVLEPYSKTPRNVRNPDGLSVLDRPLKAMTMFVVSRKLCLNFHDSREGEKGKILEWVTLGFDRSILIQLYTLMDFAINNKSMNNDRRKNEQW